MIVIQDEHENSWRYSIVRPQSYVSFLTSLFTRCYLWHHHYKKIFETRQSSIDITWQYRPRPLFLFLWSRGEGGIPDPGRWVSFLTSPPGNGKESPSHLVLPACPTGDNAFSHVCHSVHAGASRSHDAVLLIASWDRAPPPQGRTRQDGLGTPGRTTQEGPAPPPPWYLTERLICWYWTNRNHNCPSRKWVQNPTLN